MDAFTNFELLELGVDLLSMGMPQAKAIELGLAINQLRAQIDLLFHMRMVLPDDALVTSNIARDVTRCRLRLLTVIDHVRRHIHRQS